MINLSVIRHGETDWNVQRRLQGHSNPPLNASGREQGELLAKYFAQSSFPIDYLLCSDLLRTQQTAEIIQKYYPSLSVMPTAAWRERSYGVLENLHPEEASARYPDMVAVVEQRQPHAPLTNGETLGDFYQRIVNALIAIGNNEQYQHKSLVLVTHGGVLDCLKRYCHRLPLSTARDFKIPNTGINRFIYQDQQWLITDWGLTDHLELQDQQLAAQVRDELT